MHAIAANTICILKPSAAPVEQASGACAAHPRRTAQPPDPAERRPLRQARDRRGYRTSPPAARGELPRRTASRLMRRNAVPCRALDREQPIRKWTGRLLRTPSHEPICDPRDSARAFREPPLARARLTSPHRTRYSISSGRFPRGALNCESSR
ncbi:hypothetical protein NX869_30675, partial [Burkholderia thailandensis]|nr:hypothetical protein [Burkholderia thailandensis]